MRERRKGWKSGAFRLSFGAVLFLLGSAVAASAQMISSISPSSGPSGTAVTLTGSGFGKTEGTGKVFFNGTAAPVISWIDSEIVVTVPKGASRGPVIVAVDGETSNDNYLFRVIVPVSPPLLSSLSPAASPPHADATGEAVTLKGSRFGLTQNLGSVTFNGIPAKVIHWSETEIRAAVPEGATSGPVVVTVNDEPSNGLPFTIYPYITSVIHPADAAASVFTLEGAHFGTVRGEGRVTLNDLPIPIVRWTDTQVTAVVPNDTAGPVGITVNGVQSNVSPLFSVRSPAQPMISSLFPRAGPSETSVLIAGSGFGRLQSSGTVTFNETPAAVLGWSDTEIIATVPAGATTGPVVVTRDRSASNRNLVFTATSDSLFPLASITITPEHATLQVGQTALFVATGIFKNGFSQRLRSATLAAGVGHTCTVLSEGTVSCWGENSLGQLGNGSTDPSPVPTRVRGIGSATAVAAGAAHTCALLSEGRVQCWGDNSVGQLGNGTNIGAAFPVEVTGISDAAAITAGGNHTCAVLSVGSMMCWGSDRSDPHTDKSTFDSTSPIEVVGGIAIAAPALAGESHTCVLLAEGVNCWGSNTFGQLGNGSTAGSPSPVRVGGIDRATAIAAGSYHTCVVLSNGTVDCWGAGHSGRLGDGKSVGSAAPVAVDGITAATLLWTSSDRSVATVDADGRVTVHRPGLAKITATSRGVSSSTTLLVEPPAVSEKRAIRADR